MQEIAVPTPAPAPKPSMGVHEDMPAEAYHALAALSASGNRDIIERCPRYWWHRSPLNDAYEPEVSRKFDLGTAAHLALLEPRLFAERVVVIDAADFRTKAAQALRDEAYELGKTPILASDLDKIRDMRRALLAHPIARNAFTSGTPELTFLWRHPDYKLPCKARVDWTKGDGSALIDLKTHENAHPRKLARLAFDLGYFQKAAWYLDGCEACTGERPKDFFIVAIEREAPHLITVARLDPRGIEWGRQMNLKAVAEIARCLERDEEPPGYRDPARPDQDVAFTLELPHYAAFQLADRMEAGEFRAQPPSAELLALMREWQAPIEGGN